METEETEADLSERAAVEKQLATLEELRNEIERQRKESGRGFHPKMTAYDEADFARTFFTVVLPLMSEDHVLLATSSPNTGGGSYTDVIFARDADGNKLMNSVILGEPCAACKATTTPEACTHKQDELASWKNPKKMARLERVYRAIGGEAIFRGELKTMAKESVSTLFPRHLYLDLLGSRPKPVDSADRVSVVYVAIDPAGGGKCEFALTAMGHVVAKKEFHVSLPH